MYVCVFVRSFVCDFECVSSCVCVCMRACVFVGECVRIVRARVCACVSVISKI